MNKGELVEAIHGKVGGTKASVEESIKATLETISDALYAGENVALIGFGTFSVTERKARTGRNPQTGAAIKIKAKKAIKFSAGKALKDGVNDAKKTAKKTTAAKKASTGKKKC
jgi:DNA-binding protein HU-beta